MSSLLTKRNRYDPEIISIKLNIPISSVRDILKRFNETNSLERKQGSGRKKILNYKDVSKINQFVQNNPKLSIKKLAKNFVSSDNTKVCHQTIRNYLYLEDYHGYIPAKKTTFRTKK